jgi:hypothetical protein
VNKRDSSIFQTAQAVPPHVGHLPNAQPGTLRDTKVETKNIFEKWLDKIIEFIWKLTDTNY